VKPCFSTDQGNANGVVNAAAPRQQSSSFFGALAGVLCLGRATINTMPMQATKPTSSNVPSKAGVITGQRNGFTEQQDDETAVGGLLCQGRLLADPVNSLVILVYPPSSAAFALWMSCG
jgi:hypothetical protein